MRILALLTDADDAPGGIAQFNRDVLDAMAADARVAAVDVVAFTRHPPRTASTRARVRTVTATASRVRFAWQAWRAARALRPDAIWCGHLHLAPIADLVARVSGAPFWMTVHGIDAWDRPRGWRGAAAQRATGIAAVSRHTRERVLAWWRGEPTRVRVLSNTVGTRFSPIDPAAPAPSDEFAGRTVLLTVGRLAAAEAYKGHDRVIDCLPLLIATHPDLLYVIAGDGDDRARLEARAEARGVSAHVRFVGNVAHESLPDLYRAARAFAMPSTGEGFGIAFLEAMACGVPAVGLDGDGSRDPLRDGALGIVATPATLCEAIDRALSAATPRGEPLARATQAAFGVVPFRRHVGAWLSRMGASR